LDKKQLLVVLSSHLQNGCQLISAFWRLWA